MRRQNWWHTRVLFFPPLPHYDPHQSKGCTGISKQTANTHRYPNTWNKSAFTKGWSNDCFLAAEGTTFISTSRSLSLLWKHWQGRNELQPCSLVFKSAVSRKYHRRLKSRFVLPGCICLTCHALPWCNGTEVNCVEECPVLFAEWVTLPATTMMAIDSLSTKR